MALYIIYGRKQAKPDTFRKNFPKFSLIEPLTLTALRTFLFIFGIGV